MNHVNNSLMRGYSMQLTDKLPVVLKDRYRSYPTAPQRQALAQAFGCARVVYNGSDTGREAAGG
jgi:putative transposase